MCNFQRRARTLFSKGRSLAFTAMKPIALHTKDESQIHVYQWERSESTQSEVGYIFNFRIKQPA